MLISAEIQVINTTETNVTLQQRLMVVILSLSVSTVPTEFTVKPASKLAT